VACTAILWALPDSGKVISGVYYLTIEARLVQHLLVFIIAACCYRAALALGWPDSPRRRVLVVGTHILLALAVTTWSEIAIALAAGFVDGRSQYMWATLGGLTSPSNYAILWANPLRLFIPPYLMGLCAIALVTVSDRHHCEALRAAQLASAYSRMQMAMLSAQLQPHFLFNSLHAAMGLIYESPPQAATMLARLGDFLRHALQTSGSPWVDLATELVGLEAYLAVQQVRFADRLIIGVNPSSEALGTQLPSMLLQPLVENAIEHGRGHAAILNVNVTAELTGGRLLIAVTNSSPSLPCDLSPEDYGGGLTNVDLRLRTAYGDGARLRVGPDKRGGTAAVLDLPIGASTGSDHEVFST
jgi:hypothetical protein